MRKSAAVKDILIGKAQTICSVTRYAVVVARHQINVPELCRSDNSIYGVVDRLLNLENCSKGISNVEVSRFTIHYLKPSITGSNS